MKRIRFAPPGHVHPFNLLHPATPTRAVLQQLGVPLKRTAASASSPIPGYRLAILEIPNSLRPSTGLRGSVSFHRFRPARAVAVTPARLIETQPQAVCVPAMADRQRSTRSSRTQTLGNATVVERTEAQTNRIPVVTSQTSSSSNVTPATPEPISASVAPAEPLTLSASAATGSAPASSGEPAPASPAQASRPASRSTQREPTPPGLPELLFTDDWGNVVRPAGGTVHPVTPRVPPPAWPALLLTDDAPAPVTSPLPGTMAVEPAPVELAATVHEAPAVWLGAAAPHSVCAQWELPPEQLAALTAQTTDGTLHLRIVCDGPVPAPELVIDQPIQPDVTGSFIEVPLAAAAYHAEIGAQTRSGEWRALVVSAPVVTPPDQPTAGADYQEARWEGIHPRTASEPSSRSTPPDRRTAMHLFEWGMEESWQEAGASHSLAGRRQNRLLREGSAADTDSPSSSALAQPSAAPSSPTCPPSAPSRKFWFKVNAEVVLYGSTEPDARVTIGGRPIRLRPDGSFSFRFALPDGEFPLPIKALAADGLESAGAKVVFRRQTETQGSVGTHPQDPQLRPPLPDHTV